MGAAHLFQDNGGGDSNHKDQPTASNLVVENRELLPESIRIINAPREHCLEDRLHGSKEGNQGNPGNILGPLSLIDAEVSDHSQRCNHSGRATDSGKEPEDGAASEVGGKARADTANRHSKEADESNRAAAYAIRDIAPEDTCCSAEGIGAFEDAAKV